MKIFLVLVLLSSTNLMASNKTICGRTDDRVLSYDSKIGRGSQKKSLIGCTVTMIGKSCAVSAGHCVGYFEKVSFNVPNTIGKNPRASKPEDTYSRNKDFLRYKDGGQGNDWAVMKLLKNEKTGLYPGEAQGYYEVALDRTVRKGDEIRITGYGQDVDNINKTFEQQTHIGKVLKVGGWFKSAKLGHSIDTMGGNSGSTIRLEDSNEIIGIHSHGGCTSSGGMNYGTLVSKSETFKNVIRECLEWEEEL